MKQMFSAMRPTVFFFILALCLALPFGASAAPAKTGASLPQSEAAGANINFPVITIADWQRMTPEGRYAFLVGFTSALEMERAWRGSQVLPLEVSLINSWIKGLQNNTFKQIYDNVNAYAAANPGQSERPLVEWMWYEYAQPQVNEKVSKAKLRYLQEQKK